MPDDLKPVAEDLRTFIHDEIVPILGAIRASASSLDWDESGAHFHKMCGDMMLKIKAICNHPTPAPAGEYEALVKRLYDGDHLLQNERHKIAAAIRALLAQQKIDHAEINLKADFIAATLNDMAEREAALEAENAKLREVINSALNAEEDISAWNILEAALGGNHAD